MVKKKRLTKSATKETFWGWIFVFPTMIGLAILNFYPMIYTVYQSFFRTGDFGKGNVFVGLANYKKVFGDTEVWQALWNTIKYAIVEVPFSIVIALVLAALIHRKLPGYKIFRTIFFLPMVVAPAAIAMVWKWLYNSQFGLLNHVLPFNLNWISDPKYAVFSIAIIGVWSVIGYNVVLFLAGLQEVPKDYFEAAALDGANGIQRFFYITLPMISPTLFFVVVTRTIAALQVFDFIYMIIDYNNPALKKTQSLVYLFYDYAFNKGNKGYGATVIVVLLVFIMLLTVIQLRGQKRWVHYN